MCRALLCQLCLLAFLLGSARPEGLAQENPHSRHGAAGRVPQEILERRVGLRQGMGRVHEAVTASSNEAQAFYDQGLAYLHSYVWIEAARSFHQALRLDPKLAMAYVGLSRAYTGLEDPEAARSALEKAQSLNAEASERERRRIGVRAKQIEALADLGNSSRHLEYKKAIDEALALQMDDVELWLLRGNAEERTAAGRGQGGGVASVAFYEAALARSPDNLAAHHYLIHSEENIGDVASAVKHGETYARLAPAVPHAHHMYGHDLRRLGRMEDAIAEFRKADELENSYYQAENIPARYDWHHEHNLNLLSTSYQYQGQLRAAEPILREAFAIPGLTDYGGFFKKDWPEFLLARGRTQEALAAAKNLTEGRGASGRAAGHLLAARCLLALNHIEAARQECETAEKIIEEASRIDARGAWISREAAPYLEALRGEILLRGGREAQGIAVLREAQRKLRAMTGPDSWSQALFRLESIARMARQMGQWELAESTARQMLEHDPAYAGTHYALALVAEHKGGFIAARREFAEAEKLWARADSDLEELSQTRQKLALLRK